jgi:hypothetical protein
MSKVSKRQEESSSADEDVEVSNSDEYEVERIVGKKTIGSKIHYKVVWKGFPESEATWEPRSNLKGASKAIKEFKNREFRTIVSNKYQRRILQIIHAEKKGGKTIYTAVCKNCELQSLTSEEARRICPQQVIDYYIGLLSEMKRKKRGRGEVEEDREEEEIEDKDVEVKEEEENEERVVEVKEEEENEERVVEVKEEEENEEKVVEDKDVEVKEEGREL